MNPIKPLIFALMVASSLIHSTTAYSAGTLILRNKDNKICNINIPDPGETVTIRMGATPNCGDFNNETRSFQFAEVPSATKITFLDYTTCEDKAPWFRIKTTKKQTSSTIIETQYAMTFKPGQIMEAGLQMDDKLEGGDNFLDQLSCLIIQTSAVPPSSSSTTATTP